MKLQRTSFGLLLTAALMAGVVAVYENQKKSVPTVSGVDQPVSQRVFDFSETAIALVTIETPRPAPKPSPSPSPTGDPSASPSPTPTATPNSPTIAITIERVDGQWRLSAPLKVPANAATVAFLTNLLTTTQRDRTLNVSRDRLAEFGLDKPIGVIDMTLTDQKQHRLVLGKLSFDRTFLYALIDPDPNAKELAVALISPQFANAVDRDLKEWQVVPKSNQPEASPAPEAAASPSGEANPSPTMSPPPQTSPQPETSPAPKP